MKQRKILSWCIGRAMQCLSHNFYIGIQSIKLFLGTSIVAVLGACSIVPVGDEALRQIQNSEVSPQQDSSTQPVAQNRIAFQRHVYASTGFGVSKLAPDGSDISTWSISDKVNASGQLTIGADLNRHLSMEIHSADLGSAGIEQVGGALRGRINYYLHGGSALWYFGKNRHRSKREGITGYTRAGVAKMSNTAVGSAPYLQRNSTQLLLGAGFEYGSKIGLGVRVEYITFDVDAQYAQIGFVYRVGRAMRQRTLPVPTVTNEKILAPLPTLAVKVASPDLDADGVLNSRDQCSSTNPGVVVDVDGCAIFDGVLEGVNFFSASAKLTPKAKSILDEAANTLKQYSRVKIKVSAHTDNQGSEIYNQTLSAQRAESVVEYLGDQGVNRQNMISAAFGESQPVAKNNTPQGRAQNRRVELRAIK